MHKRPRSLRKSCMLANPVESDQPGTLKLLIATAAAINANGTLSPIVLPLSYGLLTYSLSYSCSLTIKVCSCF
ncbi:MAG: hypothetical protein V3T13_06340, partial [Hyphomicrobium sp.]